MVVTDVVLAALHVQLLLVDGNLKNKVTCVCLLDWDLAAYISMMNHSLNLNCMEYMNCGGGVEGWY